MLYRTAVLVIVWPGQGLTVFVKRPPYANTKVYDVMKRLAADISRDLSLAGPSGKYPFYLMGLKRA